MILMNMTLNEINSAEKILDVLLILERVCDHESLPMPTVSGAMMQGRIGDCTRRMLDPIIELVKRRNEPTLPIFKAAKDRMLYLMERKKGNRCLDDFLCLCTVDEVSNCWIQTGGVKRVTFKGRSMSLRKAIWITSARESPPKHQIISTCGNKLCVNPEHCMLKPITGNKNTRRDVRRIETQPDLALINMPWV